MRRRGTMALRFGATVVGIVAAAVAAVAVLTGTDPRALLGAGPSPTLPRARAPEAPVPLYSDDWFDDSGYSFATAFTGTIADPRSLEQLRAACEGRGHRGIAHLERQLAALPGGGPETAAHAARLQLMMGALHMFEGEFEQAADRFKAARDADPGSSEDVRANVEALLGVAALRRGEVENCVACRNESSCIFPLSARAVHGQTAGSREAVRRFTAYLDRRPDDVGVRWLLNVAAMTLGEYPGGVPKRHRIPLEPFRSRLDAGRFVNVAARAGLDARGPEMAGGCLVDDFDGDGRLDVFLSTSNPSHGAYLGINRGDGTFEDRSGSAGLGPQIGALNAKHTDFDNDGRLDVLLLRGGWETPRRLSLLRNAGGGRFEDVTVAAGLAEPIASQSGAWADYDNDGRLDVYVAGEYNPSRPNPSNLGRLYRNNGDGTFADVGDAAGVRNGRFAKGADWGDYDGDGDPDLYVSNLGQPNRLYRNNGDGTFTDVAGDLGVSEPLQSFACWFWDYDNDGRLDLWVNPYGGKLSEVVRSHLGQPTTGERPRLYHNEWPRGFRDVTVEAGLDRVLLPMGSNFGDIDNDGFLDMYLGTGKPAYSYLFPNVLFKNVDGRRFEDITASSGTGHLQKGHGVAFADWDRDGDADIVLESGGAAPGDKAGTLLFQNPGHGRHWLNVKLVGVTTNRAALGASIRLELREPGGRTGTRYRVVTTGSSFGGNPLATTIGVDRAEAITTLTVTWPTSKTRQVFLDVPMDRAIEIIEHQDAYRTLDWSPIGLPPG